MNIIIINFKLNTWISDIKVGICPGPYLFDRTYILKKNNNNTIFKNIKIGEIDEDLENIKKEKENLLNSKNIKNRN